jgi:hypothetical protein
MLIKKYKGIQLLENLDRAILYAKEMIPIIDPLYPNQLYRLLDLIKIKGKKAI